MEEIKNSEDNIGKTRKKPTRRKEGEIEKKERVEKVENFDKKADFVITPEKIIKC